MVFVSENCRRDAQAHGLIKELEAFRDRVERTQSTSLFDPFPPPYIVKKKLGGRQGRLIADRRSFGDHAVLVFLAILIRGDRAYEVEFSRDPQGYGKRHFADLVSDDELAAFVDQRTRTAPPPTKPEPSVDEYAFLFNCFSHHQDPAGGDLVCETQEWVDQVTSERVAKQLALLAEACLRALSNQNNELRYLPIDKKPGWGVWVLRQERRLFLLTVAIDSSESDSRPAAEALAGAFWGKDSTAQLRASRRAYPSLILADDELWIDLEREPLGNMALSPEETEVLESVRHTEHSFPLFVNGRAGSGKSTILQYIFADMLFFHLSHEEYRDSAPPLYLTANGELLRVARTFVERLLSSEAAFTPLVAGKNLAAEARTVIDQAFREFQPFLLSLIPVESRTSAFGSGARVDYPRFRRMWRDKFGKDVRALREFGPDISWHVIRTYVKGMSSETYLDPDDYGQLEKKQVTVTLETFKEVFDRVWEGWYQSELSTHGLWDDQDLTRYVLEHELAQPVFPAVVCDEAQDFTRLELELLLRLNVFSNRSLPPNVIRRVPFAFAGDPFQTLNPTGFRWDSIKASFVEKFVLELDASRRPVHLDLNYRELQYNYRSTRQIVRFGNHVQALRAALFQSPDVQPQTPWTNDRNAPPVVWFRSGDASFWKKFRENPGLVVVVPSADGEEAQYVEGDPVLREYIRIEDGVPVNVLSAVRAKGCEYPAVVVYGFGAAAELDVADAATATDAALTAEKGLPLEYFINRMYVAVSRPKRRLVIVDTDDGFKRLWRCAQDDAVERAVLGQIKNGEAIWGPEIEGMTMGSPDDLTRETVGDPIENAKAFESDGLARRDAFLLKQAAQAYRSAGDQVKARECRARALDADGQWYEAGEAFFEAGFVKDGVRCLWRAGKDGWKRLSDSLADLPQIQHEVEYQWARLAVHSGPPAVVVNLLTQFADSLDNREAAIGYSGDQAWSDAVAAVVRPQLEIKTDRGAVAWSAMASALGRIRRSGIRVSPSLLAQVHYEAGRFSDAVELWAESGETKSDSYRRAKAAVAPYPERVAMLTDLKLWEEIAGAYLAQTDVSLTDSQAEQVTDALIHTGRYREAYDVAWSSTLADHMLRIALDTRRRNLDSLASAALRAGMALLVRRERWDAVAIFADVGTFRPSDEWASKELEEWVVNDTPWLQESLVCALARSDDLAKPNVPLRRIRDFLRRYLIGKDRSWRHRVPLLEAGAAMERAGRFTDSLQFYETAIDEGLEHDDERAARLRWIVCKQRHLEYERQQRAADGKIRELEREIRRALADVSVAGVEDLPPFPVLPSLTPMLNVGTMSRPATSARQSPSPTMAQPAIVTRGPFKLELSTRLRRCNITHLETMSTAFVKCAERFCGGEVSFREDGDNAWTCDEWGISVRFPPQEGDPLVIRSAEHGVLLDAIL